jgi:cytoskeletal protein CcmA (bactofilin family)
MFGRKPSGSIKDRPEAAANPASAGSAPESGETGEAARAAAPPVRPAAAGFSPARSSDIPQAARPVAAKPEPHKPESGKPPQIEGKKLIVGRDICLSGEITACDMLIVEGRIEATLKNSTAIEIAASGMFKGTAEIEKADVSGVFEGDLTVRDRLVVRRSGRVKGKLRYGSIQIEPGGEISGAIEILPKPAAMPEAQAATGD